MTDPAGLQTSLHFCPDRAIVVLSGTIDRLSGPMLTSLLNATLDGGVPQVEVDVAQVDFIDIAGVRALSRAHHLGEQRGVVLTLRRPPPHIVWLLWITGTTALLPGDEPEPATLGAAVTDPGDTRGQRADERDRQADERDRQADERDQEAADMRRLDAERSRLLDERQQRVLEQQRWEDIREEVANEREQDLERREHDC